VAIHSQYVTGRKEIILYFFYVYKDLNILSVYSVCASVPFEELTASISSIYTLSLLVEELVVTPPDAGILLVTILNPDLVVSPASAYGLSTAVT